MSKRERNVARIPQHMSGILGSIENTTRKTVGYKNSLKNPKGGRGGGGLGSLLNTPKVKVPKLLTQQGI